MTIYSKISYDGQDDGQILKDPRKQQYIMFPAPIVFLNDDLKSELGIKTKKEEEEDEVKFCILKVPIDASDKDSKTSLSRFASMIWVRRRIFSSGRQH
jgi:hypothetical protein